MTDALSDNIEGYFPGGFRVRAHQIFAKGESHSGHYHYIDHLCVIPRGRFRIEFSNEDGPVKDSIEAGVGEELRPVKIPIMANMRHKLTALEDGSMFECWFSAQEADRVFPGDIKGSDGVPWSDCKSDV